MALISVEEALNYIGATAKPPAPITLPLKQADGHVLAEDIVSKVTLPPLDASAMDGYAVKLEARHQSGSQFILIGESPAGAPFSGKVGRDEAVRIFTGGAVPAGANTVIIQENVSAEGKSIKLTENAVAGKHIRKAGIDLKAGTTILTKGILLDGFACALIAAANHGGVKVTPKPKIALLANGDELVEPGNTLKKGQIVSSNPYGLGPLIESWGGQAMAMGIAPDSPAAIKAHIHACTDADIMLPIGGASVGDRDYMRQVFDGLGYSPIFTKVAVKPGKPTWFGKLDDKYVLGLPGNPASALVCAHIFLKPLIYVLTGRPTPAHPVLQAKVTQAMKANGPRAEYERAHVEADDNGQLHVTPFPRQDSSLITPFVKSNCLLVRTANSSQLNQDDIVDIMLMKSLS